jgi:hypothetical protein
MSGVHNHEPGLAVAALADDGAYVELVADGERSHQARLILSAGLAVGFAAALVARWTEPFRISLAPDALVATPLIGSTVRVPYDRIVRVAERPRTFLRGHVELDVRAAGRRPVYIRSTISDYARLTRLLRNRVPPAVRSEWKEVQGA